MDRYVLLLPAKYYCENFDELHNIKSNLVPNIAMEIGKPQNIIQNITRFNF